MIFALKLKLALAAAALAGPLAFSTVTPQLPGSTQGGISVPELVEIAPGAFAHRLAGDFSRSGKPANAPIVTVRIDRSVSIMTRQVTAAEYRRCVADSACTAQGDDRDDEAASDRAAVNISWRDAVAYADWLSGKTGMRFRLPTDEEWAYAAGSRFHDEGWPDLATNDPGTGNPAQRWLARYEAESGRSVPKALRPIGSYGVNENGLADVSGNVWEWTDTCFRRFTLDAATGEASAGMANCGVRVVEGQHRTYVTDFIRDARAGGCAVGTPPANLGFRLVRDGAGRWDWLKSLAPLGV
jgi:formylglycine-generating enzyme required for sulfatase activity